MSPDSLKAVLVMCALAVSCSPGTEESIQSETQTKSTVVSDGRVFYFMDVDPELGLAVYQTAGELGGMARISGSQISVVSEDLDFPHNIARFQDGLIISDTDRNRMTVVDGDGATRLAIEKIVWMDGSIGPLRRLNWVFPVAADEVERFLGEEVEDAAYVLACCHRTTDRRTIWWSICRVGSDRLVAVWEKDAGLGKVHGTLLDNGTMYGALSQSGELFVSDGESEFLVQVGDLRNMEISHGRLWMAGNDSVVVFDQLPISSEDRPRTFCSGIGRAHSVRFWDDHLWVVSNGMILVYDMAGTLVQKIGTLPPEEGTSTLHDRLRAIGYLE